jgi:hypothetical protein
MTSPCPAACLSNGIELEALRAEIAAGMASGTPKPAEDVFAKLERKYRAADKSKHRQCGSRSHR